MKREIKFKGWDLVDEKMLPVESIYFREDIISLNEGDNSLSDTFDMIELMEFACMTDKRDQEIWEGDLREVNGKLYKVVNDGWRFRFERNMVEFGENHDIILDEDSGWNSILKGNIYENPELLNA